MAFQKNPASHIWKFGTNVGGPTNLWPSQLPRSGHPKSSPKPNLQTSRSFHLDSQPKETKQNTPLDVNMTGWLENLPFSIGNASLFIVDVPLSCYGGKWLNCYTIKISLRARPGKIDGGKMLEYLLFKMAEFQGLCKNFQKIIMFDNRAHFHVVQRPSTSLSVDVFLVLRLQMLQQDFLAMESDQKRFIGVLKCP